MTYTIAEPCVDIKDKACVEECPVDCIYEGARMLYINPDGIRRFGRIGTGWPVGANSFRKGLPGAGGHLGQNNLQLFS